MWISHCPFQPDTRDSLIFKFQFVKTMFCHGCCHENPEGSNREFHQPSPAFPTQRGCPDMAAISLLNKGPSAALSVEHTLWIRVYSDKRRRDGQKREDNFQLKTCVELLWGLLCFCFFFLKREQLFLDLSIIIKERKTGQTGWEGWKRMSSLCTPCALESCTNQKLLLCIRW